MRSAEVLFLASLLVASTNGVPVNSLVERQGLGGGTTSNEFTQGGCRPVIFVFARATGEPGNMGGSVGPRVATGLRSALGAGNIAVQGVDYAARVGTNLSPGGADPAGVRTMEEIIDDAASRCPQSQIVVGGYSQGAALVHRAVEDRSDAVKSRIAGAVTFGDTQRQQDNNQIPNFPPEKTLIICNAGDAVCNGSLSVLPAHFAYTGRTDEAVEFLVSRINAGAGSGGGGSGGTPTTGNPPTTTGSPPSTTSRSRFGNWRDRFRGGN